jgi:small subunit ribosomal protein S9
MADKKPAVAKKPAAKSAAAVKKPAAKPAAAKSAAAVKKPAAKPAAAKSAAAVKKPAARSVAAAKKPAEKSVAAVKKPAAKPAAAAKKPAADQVERFQAVGRRKQAVARLSLTKGTGQITINGKAVEALYPERTRWYMWIHEPLNLIGRLNYFDLNINVSGGGKTGWAGAIRLAIARALVLWEKAHPEESPKTQAKVVLDMVTSEEGQPSGESSEQEPKQSLTWHQLFRRAGFMTRDSRAVYSKLAGLVKSRKRKQFSKR